MKNIIKKEIKKKKIREIDAQFAYYIAKKEYPIIMLIAALTSFETSIGHTCIKMKKIEKKFLHIKKEIYISKKKIEDKLSFFDNWKKKILNSKSISNGSKDTPLIFSNNSFYLYKSWKAENNILNFILEKSKKSKKKYIEKYSIIINNLFKKKEKIQKIAIAIALTKKISFIIGGPGTGKTTIITKFLIAITKLYNIEKIKIKIVAPTGKAINRIKESIKKELVFMSLKNIEKKLNLEKNICTIHQLLKIRIDNEQPYFNKKNLINLDFLIVDEASMIDLFMMEKLVLSLKKKTSILFLGDINQIPAIGNGQILKDISYFSKNNTYSIKYATILKKITNLKIKTLNTKKQTISDNICLLKNNYRFSENSEIHKLANFVKNRKIKLFFKLRKKKLKKISFYKVENFKQYNYLLEKIILQYSNYWNLVKKKGKTKDILENFLYYKNLVILKNGIFGIKEMNRNLEIRMQEKKIIKLKILNDYSYIYEGKPIIISKNNYSLNLLNGEIGIILMNKLKKLKAHFLSSDGKEKILPINILPKHKTAWVITVHKSQGSECFHSNLILPKKFYPILTKELIYTGITRSKNTLNIFSNKKILKKSLKNKINRKSNIILKIKNNYK